jgi:hypothetical protein
VYCEGLNESCDGGECRELHNEELHKFYSAPNINYLGEQIREDEISKSVAQYEKE